MKRLTHYYNGKVAEPRNRSEAQAMAKKLAEYEDAEEKGLLVNLPCKAGDTVYDISYQVNDSGILEFIVESIRIEKNCVYYYLSAEFSIMTMNDKVCDDDFGKTVFLTPEAAQQALKASESNREGLTNE